MDSSSTPPWDYIAKLVCIGDSGCGKSSLTIRLCEGRFVSFHDVTIGVEFGSRVVPVGPPHSQLYEAEDAAAAAAATAAATATAFMETRADASPPDDIAAAGSQAPSSLPPTHDAATAAATAVISGLPEPRRALPPGVKPPPQKHMKLSLWDTAGQETYKSVTRSYFRGASGALLVFDLARKQTFLHVQDWLDDLRQIAEPDIVVVLVGNKSDLTETGDVDDTATGTNQRQVTRREAEDWARRNGVLAYVETSAKSGENVEHAFLRVADRIYRNIEAGRYDLNDRRSGVKGHGATSGSAAAAAAAASASYANGLRLDGGYSKRGNSCC